MKIYDDRYVPEDAKQRRDVYINLPENEDFKDMLAVSGGTVVDDNILWFPVEGAKHTVVLIPGGRGTVEIQKDIPYPQGHLAPSSFIPHFKELGVNVALVHAGNRPLAWLTNQLYARAPWLALRGRTQPVSAEWLKDRSFDLNRAIESVHYLTKSIRKVIEFSEAPTTIIGTCNSNWVISQYYHTYQSRTPCHALVFSSVNSPPTRNKMFNERCNFFNEGARISTPVHVIHHLEDISDHTGPDIAQLILDQYTFDNAQLTLIEGGRNEGHPKLTFGYHGFRDREYEYTKTVVDWLNSL